MADLLLLLIQNQSMKKILGIAAVAVGLMFVNKAMAQIQIGAQGSYLKGTGDNNASLWGGGAHLKFYLGNILAVGGVVRTYPKQTSKTNYTSGGTNYTVTNGDYITNISGSAEIMLGGKTSLIQPFIGADAGVSINNQTVTVTSNGSQTATNNNGQTFFLASPKAGINLGLLPSFGVFGVAQYNLVFGSGNQEDISFANVPNPIKSTPVDKYFTFDVGVYFRLTGAKSR